MNEVQISEIHFHMVNNLATKTLVLHTCKYAFVYLIHNFMIHTSVKLDSCAHGTCKK